MNYKDYLKDVFGPDVVITDELNFDYNGEGLAIVIKYLSGNHFQDSTIIPIQLAVYTDDVASTKILLDSFTKSNNDTSFMQGFVYVRQFYSTPIVLGSFEDVGINYMTQFIVSGTLVVSENISDIKEVFIDDVKYMTTTRLLTYVGQPDNQRRSGQFLNETFVKFGMLKFSANLIHKASPLSTKIRRILTGNEDIDTNFKITLVYTENELTEEYTMKLDSVNINSENQALPLMTVSFIK